MSRAVRALAIAALLAAPAAQAFMFGATHANAFNTQAVAQAMKAVSKFQPKVKDTPTGVTFQFEADAKEDVDVSMSKMGAASVMNVTFKNAALPQFFQQSSCTDSTAGLSRSFFMPPSIAAENMTTSWEGGVLTVTLPKKIRDEVKRASSPRPQQQRQPQQPTQQQREQSNPSASYLDSLSQPQQQPQQQQERPKATKKPAPRGSQASSASSTQPATAGQYIDQMLSEMFGVAPGTDPFAPPSAEWVAAAEERAAKAEEARIARRNAMRRASMHTTWEQDAEQYTITIEIPQGTRASAVKLVVAEGRALEVRLANGNTRRIQLPRDARVSAVKARFERDGDRTSDLVARCVVTVPKEQPQTINIEMA